MHVPRTVRKTMEYDYDLPPHLRIGGVVGFGKTLPMLLLGHLLPQGARSEILKPQAIHTYHRLHNNDPGAAHHHRAAAAGRLQEIGPNCHCWQPGETLNLQSSINEKFMLHITLTLGFCC